MRKIFFLFYQCAFFTWARRVILYAVLQAVTKKNFIHKLRCAYLFYKDYCFYLLRSYSILMLKSYSQKIKIKILLFSNRLKKYGQEFVISPTFSRDTYLLHDLVVAKPGGNCFGAELELCISRTAQSQRKSFGTVHRAATPLFGSGGYR
jgi:hypothetical protein